MRHVCRSIASQGKRSATASEPRIGEQSSATATETAAAAVSLISSTIPIVISIHDIILYDDTTTCFSVVSTKAALGYKHQWPQHLRQRSSPQCGPSGSFVVEANPVCSLNLTHFNYCNVFAAVCALQMDTREVLLVEGGGWTQGRYAARDSDKKRKTISAAVDGWPCQMCIGMQMRREQGCVAACVSVRVPSPVVVPPLICSFSRTSAKDRVSCARSENRRVIVEWSQPHMF